MTLKTALQVYVLDEIESTPFEIKRIELDFTESLWNILKVKNCSKDY